MPMKPASSSTGPSMAHQPGAMAPVPITQNTLLQQAASDICRNQSLRAREILTSSNTPSAVLPLLQQGSLQLSIGNGFAGLPHQAGSQPVDFGAILSGFVGMSRVAGNPLHLQQRLANQSSAGASILGQTPSASAALNLPPAALASFSGGRGMKSLVGTTHQRATPTSQEVQDALATIAAATGTPMPAAPTAKVAPRVTEPDKSPSPPGHSPTIVYMECDEDSLSDYQCLLRKQIELFEATPDDVQWNAQGRNKAIVLGQVGIRCRYCAQLATWSRARGAVYYSATLDGLYQAAQNMAKNHLCRHCRLIPETTKWKLVSLRDCKRRAAGGKKYWAEGARVLGVVQSNDGLRFRSSLSSPSTATAQPEEKK